MAHNISKYAVVITSIGHRNVDHQFHYRIPDNLRDELRIGMRVNIPFGKGNRIIKGYVVDFVDTADVDDNFIKDIDSLSEDYLVISPKRIELANWMKEKYYTTLANCFSIIIPKIVNEKTFALVKINDLNQNINDEITKILKRDTKQKKVLELLLEKGEVPISYVKSILGVDNAPINALIKKDIVTKSFTQEYRGNSSIDLIEALPPKLNEEQELAVNTIYDAIDNRSLKPILIHGVTGSGKTEIYLRAIEKVLSKGKEAIVLVPEISLTQQTVERFVERFGDKVAVTHSRLSDGERYDQWTRAKRKEISVMIGPRSAIFTPFDNIGVVIIDEEHESTYKSDQQSPKYDAREVAIKMSEIYDSLTILGSATPSVVSYNKVINGEYKLIEVKNRVNNTLPDINIVDMRKELAHKNLSMFSKELKDAIGTNLVNKEQTILFLNRRGHSTFVSCRACGYVMKCDNCNVNYTYHKGINKLSCHYCGTNKDVLSNCPECGSKYIKYFGSGTEKVEQEVLKFYPEAKILRMDLDTTKKKNSHQNILDEFRKGNADILIGTQMIAKGLDFPNVTLVGVVAADLSLNVGDYRSGENTYQLVSQVSGRAGRANKSGKVYIQTYSPEHYSIKCAANNDYLSFYNEEISFRRQMNYPPFTNIFVVMISGENELLIKDALATLKDIMKHYNKNNMFYSLGPTPAAISRINNIYRWHIMVKCNDEEKIKGYVLYCLDKLSKHKNLDKMNVGLYLNPNFGF